MKTFTVGITGASGAIYGVRLVQVLLEAGCKVHLVLTEAAWQVFKEELEWDTSDREKLLKEKFYVGEKLISVHSLQDFKAPIASGSYPLDGMVIIPCTMGTLSKIAHGSSSNLLERAADVMLKEGKRLVIVPRETPLNSIHLENMQKIIHAGGKIVPAMPGFYHKPKTLEDIVDFLVGKVLDQLGVTHQLFTRWGDGR